MISISVTRLIVIAAGTLALSSFAWADITGTVWEGIPNAGNAADTANMASTLASANFTSTGIDYCAAEFPVCPSTPYDVKDFLNNPTFTNQQNGFSATGTADNIEVQLIGTIFLNAGGNSFDIAHDDGLTISLDGGIGNVLNDPGPTGPTVTPFTITAPTAGTYTFTLDYSECCGSPAVLAWTYPTGAPVGAVPEPKDTGLFLAAALGVVVLVRRKLAGVRA